MQYLYVGTTNRDADSLVLYEGQAVRFVDEQELASLPIAYGFDAMLREFFAITLHAP